MDGKNRIGSTHSAGGKVTFNVYSPVTGELLPVSFSAATGEELAEAVRKAQPAHRVYREKSGKEKAAFLRAIADEIGNHSDAIIERAGLETGLPEGRLQGECNRTTSQLRMFAGVVEEGSWVEASIDPGSREGDGIPKPDIRKMLVPLGVVGVFTASNFPLAFSTAGGDTASAFAAGNAVIVKAHPYHAGTSELVGDAILLAAEKTGMPEGIFSSLNSADYSVGQALVSHPGVNAISFTGSYKGGKALYDLAQEREEIIPVFTEMGSVNPVVLLPGMLARDPAALAKKLAASILLGSGQFCTNPGIMVSLHTRGLEEFREALAKRIEESVPQRMLQPAIRIAYREGLEKFNAFSTFQELARGTSVPGADETRAVIGRVPAQDFIQHPELSQEVFGPFSLLVECGNEEELTGVLHTLRGQLTATVMGTGQDMIRYKKIIQRMRDLCGRLIFNGVPTGVEVGYSMHHGGPFPATSDSRFTSVGVDAIKRFTRPVAYQDAPEEILPDELKNRNSLNIWRRIDGQMSRDPAG